MEITINLIPPHKRREIERNETLKTVYRFGILLILIGSAFYGALWSFNYILDLNLKAVSEELDSSSDRTQLDKIKNLDNQFVMINKQLSEVDTVRKDQIYWSRLLEKLSASLLDGIVINSMETKNYQISLVGKAKDRDTLIAFKDKLYQDGCFTSVNLPLSNLSSKIDINFQMDLTIKDNCLKNQ
jgi:Tfp pilus assembly protein PilN